MELKKKHDVCVIAHRGYNAKYPENTLLAFEKSIEVGADYVELDVHLSGDGEIVVIHDGSTKRVGDKDLDVESTDLATLKTVDLGEGQTIPTLQEVFDLCKGKIGVQVEIKQDGMAQKVIDLIKKNGMEKEVFFSSFKHSEMVDAKSIDVSIGTATLEPTASTAFKATFYKKSLIKQALKKNADATHPYFKLVNKKMVDEAHKQGILVNPWTVDNESDWEKLVGYGVDGIITNNPEGLIDFL